MKYLIATDIHGSYEATKNIVEKFNEFNADKLVLLGDFYYHGPRNPFPEEYAPMKVAELLNGMTDKIIAIKGNCDAEIDETISNFKMYGTYTVEIGGKKVMFTHGQNYNKDNTPAREEADVLVYGHFHVDRLYEANGIICINVASASLPKEDCPKSFAILDEAGIAIFSFSGEKILSYKF